MRRRPLVTVLRTVTGVATALAVVVPTATVAAAPATAPAAPGSNGNGASPNANPALILASLPGLGSKATVGPAQKLGNGDIRTFTVERGGKPVSIGVTFPASA